MGTPLIVPSTFTSVDDVLTGLTAVAEQFLAAGDRRSIFVEAYILITQELRKRILAGGAFENGDWVASYLIRFGELYRVALVAYETKDEANLPRAWKIAFDTAAKGDAVMLQHLLLGINAHINHDLPNALSTVGIDPDRARAKRDHDAVNAALRTATDPVKEKMFTLYAPALGLLDRLVGPFDDEVTNWSFHKAREAAWDAGVSLVNARDPGEHVRTEEHIDNGAAVLARLLLGPSLVFPGLVGELAKVEAPTFPLWSIRRLFASHG